MTENIQNDAAPEVQAPEPTMREAMGQAYQELKEKAPVESSTPELQENNQGDKVAPAESEGDDVQTPSPILAPTSWSDEDKAVFSKLPPDAQNVIAKRESERDNFLQQQSRQFNHMKQEYGAIDSQLTDIKHVMRENNLTAPQMIKEFVGLYKLSERDPVQYMNMFAQSKGLNLQQIASGKIDPTQINLQTALSKISELENRINSSSEKEEQSANVYAQTEVEKFSANPENKYMDTVRDDMAMLLREEKAKDLQDAYDKACRMNPDIYAELEKDKAAKSAKEQNKKALDAKKSAGVRIRTKEMSTAQSAPTSIRDTMKEVYRELKGDAA